MLPEFELVDRDATDECTIQDLIAHRCRLPQYDIFLLRPLEKGEDLVSTLDMPKRTSC